MDHLASYQKWTRTSSGIEHFSTFHKACVQLDLEEVERWLRHNEVEPNGTLDYPNCYGFTPLHMVVHVQVDQQDKQLRTKMVNLLSRHLNVNAQDNYGSTPLHLAASNEISRAVVLRILICRGADTTAVNYYGKTAFQHLIDNSPDLRSLEVFIQNASNTFNPATQEGYLGQMVATKEVGTNCIFTQLYNKRFDPTVLGPVDRNWIHNVVSSKETVDMNVSKLQYTSISIECIQHWINFEPIYKSWIEMLIRQGCDIDKKDRMGKSALHLAVNFMNRSAVIDLLNLGADVNAIDFEGNSPFSLAMKLFTENKNEKTKSLCQILNLHLRELKVVGLHVSQQNQLLLNKSQVINPLPICPELDYQLKIAENIEMYPRGWKLSDFLRQLKKFKLYPRLRQDSREAIDRFCTIPCENVLHLSKFIKFQLKYLKDRAQFIIAVEQILTEFCDFSFPALCIDIIFQYLSNDDFRNMEAAKNLLA